MNGVREMSDVDGPHSNTDHGYHFTKLFPELVQFLAKGRFYVLVFGDTFVNLSCKEKFVLKILSYF